MSKYHLMVDEVGGSALNNSRILLGRKENALINRIEADFSPDKSLQHKITRSLEEIYKMLENEPMALCEDTDRVIDTFDIV